MRTLVIDTATAACSVALIEGGVVVARIHEVLDRGHAERLVPMIAELPGGGRADGIAVDCGPGSFTGLRVGIAAARGLGLGWGAPVHGFSSTTLIAAAAFAAQPRDALAVVLEAGHGEVFMQSFTPALETLHPLASLKPEAAVAALGGLFAIGNGARRLLAIDPAVDATEALPDAANWPLLPQALAALPPHPIYGRAPDAKLPPAQAPSLAWRLMATRTIQLRAADARDIDAVDRVMAAAFDPRFGEAWNRNQTLGVLAMPGVRLTIALVDDAPAGFAMVRAIMDEAELLLLAVAPPHRRTGVGGALLRAVEADCSSRDVRKLHLEVRAGNSAVRLYATHGFTQIGERRGYYRGNAGQSFDAHTYTKPLS